MISDPRLGSINLSSGRFIIFKFVRSGHGLGPLVRKFPEYEIRSPEEGDQGYIASSWVNSVLNGPHLYVDREDRDELNRVVTHLLDDLSTRIRVLCDKLDRHKIYGWIAFSEMGSVKSLLYIVVRNSIKVDGEHIQLRMNGLANKLFRDAGMLHRARTVYLFEGPSYKWMKEKYPWATKMEIKDYFKA